MIVEIKEHHPLLSYQCIWYPCCSKNLYLLHKAIIYLKVVSVIGIFESVETPWCFITVAHLLVKDVWLVSILLSQSLLRSVITDQCLAVLSVNQNLGTLKAPQFSRVRISL